MQSVIIIPARLGSTRLPGKLLLAETGQPLICHTVQTAVNALRLVPERIVEVIVATDDEKVHSLVNHFCREEDLPARAVMTRRDHPTGSDRIAEVADGLDKEIRGIVNLQGDEPEMAPENLVQVLGLLVNTECDIGTLVFPLIRQEDLANPALVKAVFGKDGRALYFSRAPVPCDRDGVRADGDVLGYGHMGIYAYRREALMRFVSMPQGVLEGCERLEQLRALENGMTIRVSEVEDAPPKGIDTQEDYDAFVRRTQ